MALWTLSLLFLGLCMLAGFAVSQLRTELIEGWGWGLLAGFGFGGLLIAVDEMVKGFSLRAFSAASFGLGLGALIALLIDKSGLFIYVDEKPSRWLIRLCLFLGFGYIGMILAMRSNKEDFYLIIPFVRFALYGIPVTVVSLLIASGSNGATWGPTMAETMNAMLARLEAAQVRQRQFVSDASQEYTAPELEFLRQAGAHLVGLHLLRVQEPDVDGQRVDAPGHQERGQGRAAARAGERPMPRSGGPLGEPGHEPAEQDGHRGVIREVIAHFRDHVLTEDERREDQLAEREGDDQQQRLRWGRHLPAQPVGERHRHHHEHPEPDDEDGDEAHGLDGDAPPFPRVPGRHRLPRAQRVVEDAAGVA